MKALTSRERLDRCFKQMETDRPGLSVRGVGFNRPKDETYKPLRELVVEKGDLVEDFRLPEIEGTTRLDFSERNDSSRFSVKKDQFNDDFTRYTCTLHTPEGDLSQQYMVGKKGQGYIVKHFIETPEDAEKYLTLENERIVVDFDKFFELDRKIGDRGIVLIKPCQNPAGTVVTLMGSERFAYWSIDHRDILHRLMERRRDYILDAVKILIENKVGPYFSLSGQEEVTPPLHGLKDFYDFNVKYDKPIVDLIHNAGGYVHIHSHGSLSKVLDGFLDIGMDVLHPIEPPPMGDVPARVAKEKFRGKVCIEGNIQIGDMYTCESEEIRNMVMELIKDTYDDSKGLIVCQSASPYIRGMSQKVFDNYSMLIQTVLNYKKT